MFKLKQSFFIVLSHIWWSYVFQGEDYEIRTYHTTNWVSTSVTGMEQDPAFSTGFRRLFKYIQGNNDKSKS